MEVGNLPFAEGLQRCCMEQCHVRGMLKAIYSQPCSSSKVLLFVAWWDP